MRRLLAICSAVGLLCAALGCHSSCGSCVHGRCDCGDEPCYGCHYGTYGHVLAAPAAAAAPAAPIAEPLKVMPKGDEQ